MKIKNISLKERRSRIPLKGWQSVVNAVSTYAKGFTRGARATEQVTTDDIGRSHGSKGGLAVALYNIGGAIVGGRGELVDNLLKEAEEVLKTRTRFNKSYDYDGMGTPFFKANVDIEVLDRELDMYSVSIYAAYVGDKPEQGLAKYFDIPRMLISCSVEVETFPLSGNRFEFDFEPVLRKLDRVLDTKDITGEQVVSSIMTMPKEGNRDFRILQIKDGFEVSIKTGRIEDRMDYTHAREPRDTWSSKGSTFSGELARDWNNDDKNAKATPTFLIVVCHSQKNYLNDSLPIWQPDLQQKAIELALEIATALQ